MQTYTSNRFCRDIEGVNLPHFFSEECLRSALQYQPKVGDIFIVTYPKCGTTWMQNLVLNILRRGKPFEKPVDIFLASPFLDQLGADESENRMIHPGAYKSHLPYSKVPWSNNAKYIYVARNVKDCCISLYYHMKQLPGYQFADGEFTEFLDYFVDGKLEFGDYFEHLIPWYNMRNNTNVFFTTYENMKCDLKKVALEVADFIREGESKFLEANIEILEKILHNCSFREMKKFYNEALSTLYNVDVASKLENLPKGRKHIVEYVSALPKRPHCKLNFVRKGEVGSWKQELTPTENNMLNRMISEKTKGSDVMTLWSNVM